MGNTYEAIAMEFLNRHCVANINSVLTGFDLAKPVYVNSLNPGDRLQQFIRNPSHFGQSEIGNWFSLLSGSMSGVSIFGGLSGRVPHTFSVTYPLQVLEGTARKRPQNWKFGVGGGSGGGAQIYIPSRLLGHLKHLGPSQGP